MSATLPRLAVALAVSLASRALGGCVSAGARAGPAILAHTSGAVGPGGSIAGCLGLSNPPEWSYCNPVTLTAAYDLRSGRALLSGTLGAEVFISPQPWGLRAGLHGGFVGWADAKLQDYQVAATASLVRLVTGDRGNSDSTTWSLTWSLDGMAAITWGDDLGLGGLFGLGVSVAYDWMKGRPFLSSIR